MNFTKTPAEGSDGNFLKLEPGGIALGVFRGDPKEFYVLWPKGGKPVPCEPGTAGSKFRFQLNFVTKKDGKHTPVIWEQGAVVYNQLKELHKDYPLNKTIVKVTRHGSGTDTTYSVLPIPKGSEVTPELEATLSALKLNDLSSEAKPEETFAPAAPPQEEELPF